MLELARRFLADGMRVDVVNLAGDGELALEVPPSARYLAMGTASQPSRLGLAISSLGLLRRYLLNERPDVVLGTMTGTNLVTLLAARIAAFRGRVIVREAASTLNASRGMKWLIRSLYGRADHVITVSQGVADDLAALGLSRDRMTAIPNPIDADRIRALAGGESHLPVKPYLITVGRMTPQKDQVTLLEAFAASNARSTHTLILVGGGPERARLQALVDSLQLADVVHFAGPLENPYPLMAKASLLVLSSRWEGYPNVLLEAIALGVPVVSTDCRSGPAELLEHGRFGRLVAVGDVPGLANAVDRELEAPSGGGSEVLRRHLPSVIADRYAKILLEPYT